MSQTSNSLFVDKKITETERINWHLIIDATYKADPTKKNKSADVLSKLLEVGNQGGFRYRGEAENPSLVVLFTSGEDIYWKDEFDSASGLLLYYGDQKEAGRELHETKLNGNRILRYIFELASSQDFEKRKKIPPIFVFKKAGGWDVRFLGLAVPGMNGKPIKDWLTAVWGCKKNGERFQNYKAYFTVLDTSSGCDYEPGAQINLAWLTDIYQGNAYDSDYAPKEWKKYIKNNKHTALTTRIEKCVRTKEEQLPSDPLKQTMLTEIHDYFVEKDHGYSFEKFAAKITKYMDSSVDDDISVTRPYKDGGIDAIGRYKIFKQAENIVYVDFYLQAKCYAPNYSIKVKDTSRLISRIKNRQFGILFTTSYVDKQAYQELIEDGHPIVLITGRNIIDYIFDQLEIRDVDSLQKWLEKEFEED